MIDELKQNKLPPIIVDYIEKIKNPHISDFTKDFYIKNLERIRDIVSAEIEQYYKRVARRK